MPEIISSLVDKSTESPNIKLLSDEVQEIISRKPNWIVTNGILVLLVIIVTLLSATFFISYPDVITANAWLTSMNAPKEIRAKTEGMLIKLLVKEGHPIYCDVLNHHIFQETKRLPVQWKITGPSPWPQ